jgi:RimJ/RimL family protein N-acetyltransferase
MGENFIVTQNIGILNSFINHPDIFDSILYGNDKSFKDATNYISQYPYIIFYFPQKGCLLCYKDSDNMWEIEIFILKSHRGKFVLDAAKTVINYMFSVMGVEGLRATIPEYNKASKLITRQSGFSFVRTEPDFWQRDGKSYAAEIYELKNEQSS